MSLNPTPLCGEYMIKKRSIPNIFTLFRILLIPTIVVTFYYSHTISLVLFVIATITDFFDGYLARKYNAETDLGTILDPIADKVLVSAVLIVLVDAKLVSPIAVIIILAREFLISGLRDFSARTNFQIPVSPLAKIKTAVQMIAIIALMANIDLLGNILIWIATTLTVITGYMYVVDLLKWMRRR